MSTLLLKKPIVPMEPLMDFADHLFNARGTIGEIAALEQYARHLALTLGQKEQQRQKSSDELTASRALLHLQGTALENAANAILITNAKGIILWVNPAFTTLTGYTAEEVIGKTPRILKSGYQDEHFYREFWKTILGKKTWRGEFTNRRKDGSFYQDEHTVTPVCSPEGEITHFIGIMQDVTLRKQTEEQIADALRFNRTMLDASSMGIIAYALSGEVILANEAAATVVGGSVNQLKAQNFRQIDSWKKAGLLQAAEAAIASGREQQLDAHFVTTFGKQAWLACRFIPFQYQQQTHLLALFTDISEQKRAELRRAVFGQLGHKLNTARTAIEAGEIIMDAADELFGWDACTLDLYSAKDNQLHNVLRKDIIDGQRTLCPSMSDHPPSPRAKRVIENGPELILRDASANMSDCSRFGDTTRVSASLMLVPIRDGSKVIGLITIQSYKTNAYSSADLNTLQALADYCGGALNRIHTEAALRRIEELYRRAIVGAGAVPYSYDYRTKTYNFISGEITQLIGYGPEEISPTLWKKIIGESIMLGESAGLNKEEAARRVTAGELRHWRCDMRVTTREGQTRWISDVSVQDVDASGCPIGSMGILQDITDRRQTEQALRESEERFREFAENIEEVFWIVDSRTDQLLYVSPAYEKIWGRTCESLRLKPQDWMDCVHPEDRERVRKSAAAKWMKNEYEEIYRIVRPDGNLRWIHDKGFPIRDAEGNLCRFAGVAEDITERKNADSIAHRSQRLEAIGTLAGGVAHDLNNALAPIMMGVEILKMEFPERAQLLDMFESSARRGAEMVRQLLTFARGAEGERVSIQPKHLLKEMYNLMKGSFPKNIQLSIKSDPQLSTVSGDATQLHQILLNLCVNARDAMPQGGTLTLEAQTMEVDAVYANSMPNAKPGKYVVFSVRDTGTGISPEIMDRIFDPFFTTKGPDKGTGLGLSTVMGIVKGHNGFLHVTSQPGKGSNFCVYLPAERVSAETEIVRKDAVKFCGKGETILLVDDEATLRDMGRGVLRRLNFNPLTATDGADGLIQVVEHRTELRAIITDLHMPQMDGLYFVRALRRILPQIPIIIASGRMDELTANEFKNLGVIHRLDKPFTEKQLAETLRTALGC